MGLTSELAKYLGSIVLDEYDREKIRILILDFFTAAFAGYRQNASVNMIVKDAVLKSDGNGESNIIFEDDRYPARMAAFMNAFYGHGADMDDGNKKACGHMGVHIIPAVFALADRGGINEDVLTAIAVGYETFVRISSAVCPGIVERGFHTTGTVGTIATAAACARLLSLDAAGIESAMALSTTMSAGLLSYGDSRPEVKPLNPAKAAENGLLSAVLAGGGIKGPANALEGKNGWLHAYTGHFDEDLLKKHSDKLLLHDTYMKLYPSCRHTHGGIDAAIALHARHRWTDIRKIEIFTYKNAIRLAGIKFPKNRHEAKFSVAYTTIYALMHGSYGLADMDRFEMSEEIGKLIASTEINIDSSLENPERGIRGTRVRITLCDGSSDVEEVLFPKGDPENPLEITDIRKKLVDCSEGLLEASCVRKLADGINSIREKDVFRNPMADMGKI